MPFDIGDSEEAQRIYKYPPDVVRMFQYWQECTHSAEETKLLTKSICNLAYSTLICYLAYSTFIYNLVYITLFCNLAYSNYYPNRNSSNSYLQPTYSSIYVQPKFPYLLSAT